MTDSRFDQIIREKLEGYQVEVGDGLWSGIEQKMAAAHRRKVAFRVSMISLAAAACLAVGLVLAVDRGDSKIALPAVAESVDITPEAPHEEVTAPVQEIKSVSTRTAVAVNSPSRETPQPVAPEPVIVAEPMISEPVVPETVTVTEAPKAAPEVAEQAPEVKPVPAEIRYNQYERPDIRDITVTEQVRKETPSRGFNIGVLASALPALSAGGSSGAAPMFSANLTSSESNSLIIEQIDKSQYSLPIVFGINGVVDLTDRFSLGIGLNYSYLETSFDAYVNKVGYRRTSMQLHYLGLSLDGYYRFIKAGPFSVYAKAGFEADKGLHQRYVYGSQEVNENGIKGVQLSVNAGVGAEWRPVPVFGLYVEPTANYFFNTHQPISLHTNQPFSFGLSAGFRFYVNRPF